MTVELVVKCPLCGGQVEVFVDRPTTGGQVSNWRSTGGVYCRCTECPTVMTMETINDK